MSGLWFRYYTDALEHPKVQTLPAGLFRHWVNLLCVAKAHDGYLPTTAETAFRLRISEGELQEVLSALIKSGLLDLVDDQRITPHNWEERQYPSDVSSDRVRRYRNKHKTVPETFPKRSRNGAEKSREEQIQSRVEESADTPGFQISEDWWLALCSRWPGGANPDRDLRELISVCDDHAVFAANTESHLQHNKRIREGKVPLLWFIRDGGWKVPAKPQVDSESRLGW